MRPNLKMKDKTPSKYLLLEFRGESSPVLTTQSTSPNQEPTEEVVSLAADSKAPVVLHVDGFGPSLLDSRVDNPFNSLLASSLQQLSSYPWYSPDATLLQAFISRAYSSPQQTLTHVARETTQPLCPSARARESPCCALIWLDDCSGSSADSISACSNPSLL
jgi:hypothetical protein